MLRFRDFLLCTLLCLACCHLLKSAADDDAAALRHAKRAGCASSDPLGCR